MKITRKDPFTGQINTRELPVTDTQYLAWENGELAQHAFPNLNADDREFIITGITDWDKHVPNDERN